MQQSDRAVLRLREMILSGELAPGARLSELALVERLGMSRTPVRLALVRLDEEGLVAALPAGGFIVREFTEADVFDAIEVRGTLEGLAVRLAAESVPPAATLALLKDCLDQLDRTIARRPLTIDDFSRYMALNQRFHDLLLDLAQSPMVRRSVLRITSLPFASPSAFVMAQAELPASHDMLVFAQEQHRCLVEAIEAGEGGRAEALAREHARLAKRNLQVVMRNQRAFQQMPGAALIRRRRQAA